MKDVDAGDAGIIRGDVGKAHPLVSCDDGGARIQRSRASRAELS